MRKLCIGIAGFGVVGKSYLRYLCHYGTSFITHNAQKEGFALGEIAIWDEKEILDKESIAQSFLKITIYDKNAISFETFLQICDYVLISAGIPQSKEPSGNTHIMSELDVFAHHNTKPTIAITGSLGKTTITTLIYKLLQVIPVQESKVSQSKKILMRPALGGNIGISMLDLLQQTYDISVLELSSFQLARNHSYRPTIAIWNNIYPNHLDWHGTNDDYFSAKCGIWKNQKVADKLIIPHSFFMQPHYVQRLKSCQSQVYVVNSELHELSIEVIPFDHFHVFYVEQQTLYVSFIEHGKLINKQEIVNLTNLPTITFTQNWIFVLGALFLAGVDMPQCMLKLQDEFFTSRLLKDHAHRLERYLSVLDVDFYNDSKATIVQATQAAIDRLAENKRPIIVILGGLDKGVDRASFVQNLLKMPHLKQVYYFGKQAELFAGCKTFASLQEVIDDVFLVMQPGDQVLFSPSGASFDFFTNYQQRGNFFKELVQNKVHSLQ